MAGFVDVAPIQVDSTATVTPNYAYVDVKNTGTTDISKGDVTIWDTASGTDGTQVKAGDTANSTLFAGIALDDIKVGKEGRIVVWGAVTAKASGTIAAGDLLHTDASAGVTKPTTAALGQVVGVALAAAASNQVRMLVAPK